MRTRALGLAAALLVAFAHEPGATGLMTCNSGPEQNWRPESELKQRLEAKGWQVRRIKVDGGCYEVYAIDDQGRRVEAYFHPESLEHLRSFTR